MTTTQRPPIGRADTAPTAAQKVVAAMWTLGKPATTKAIAAAAGVGYSTVTPILRNLLADNQAVKTDDATGPCEWQLTATLPTPTRHETEPTPTAIEPEPAPPADSTDATAHQPDEPDEPHDADNTDGTDQTNDSANPADAPETGDPSGEDVGAEPVPDTRSGSDDADTGADAASTSDVSAAAGTAPDASQDAEPGMARTYRKPEQPRRPKGELRAAVLAVLTRSPDEPFKVSEVCKAIDAANTDGTSNRAGAGAVANALDKLVTSGDAIRVEEAKYATYQAAPAGG
jgi:hypothetical protein